MSIRYDRAPIKASRNEDGFIHDTPVLTRTGGANTARPKRCSAKAA